MANPINNGIEINNNSSGYFIKTSPFKENSIIKVVNKAIIDIFSTTGRYEVSNQVSPLDEVNNFLVINPSANGKPIKNISEIINSVISIGIFWIPVSNITMGT